MWREHLGLNDRKKGKAEENSHLGFPQLVHHMKSYYDNWDTGNDFVLACSVHGEEVKYIHFKRRI
jgi:hypothetical protein